MLTLLAALITFGLTAHAAWPPPRRTPVIIAGTFLLLVFLIEAADNLPLVLGLLLPALALMGLACILPASARAWLGIAAPLVGALALAASVKEFFLIFTILYQISQAYPQPLPTFTDITMPGIWRFGVGFLMAFAGGLLTENERESPRDSSEG